MTYIRHLLKAYPVSCFYILMIWILCFATIPSTPARQRHFDRQMGTHSHVRRHLRHYMARISAPSQHEASARNAHRIALRQATAELDKAVLPRLDCAHTDERRHRDSAGILHGRTPQRRLARLRSQLNRSDSRCGRRRRNGDAKETPPILKRRHIIRLFVFACFLSFYSYKLMLQEQTPIEWL